MRPNKALIAVILAGLIFAGVYAQEPGLDDLAAYYGFEEIEIIKLDWGIKDLRIADFNRDGRSDIAVANNLKAKIELLIQREQPGPEETEVTVDPEDMDVNVLSGTTRFDRENIPVSEKIHGLVSGDLNSDGRVDLAFYGEPRGLYVILQKAAETGGGEAKSLSWRTRRKIKIDDGVPSSGMVVCADLNNDGSDDLALAATNGVYIILQKEDGTLAEPVKYPTSAQTLGVRVADLDGDGIKDLILVTNDVEKPVHVRFGLETGLLGPQVPFFVERPFALRLNNIDGIAGEEILTIDGRSGRLICYKLTKEGENDPDWPIWYYPLAAGEASTKRDLVVGDFDGDGLADVVISDPGAAELVFYRQRAGVGLAEPERFPAFSDITSLAAADINGDGKSELGVLSVKEKVAGISRFKDDRLTFPAPLEPVGEPLAMELADVDGDGKVDCLYVSKGDNDVRTLRAIYDVGAQRKTEPNAPEESRGDSALELKKLSSNPDGISVIDADQDGLPDVLIFVQYELPTLVRQVEKGRFEVIDSPGAQMSLIKDASLSSIAAADLDGEEGKELLVAQKNFARSLVFSEGKSWRVVDQYNAKSTENKVSAVAAFDLYGGDRPAVLLLDGQKGQLQILKPDEDKIYRFEKELGVGKWNASAHLKMLFAGLTGGGGESILLFDSEKYALVTPPGGGSVPSRLEQQFSYETKIKNGTYGNLTAGDINSDNRTDIIVVDYKGSHIEILALDAGLKPVSAMRFKVFEQKSYRESREPAKASVEPREMRVADVTGDGRDDLVTVIHDRIIIYPQD
ncbi:MAG: VCBS repeat-containing protein [Phycisphaerales bacterium]|nr:MAG: VCBS repeat-containing protein [Phycisphaerales bacterium]